MCRVYWHMKQKRSGAIQATNACGQKLTTWEELYHQQKEKTPKPESIVSFLDYSLSKKGKAPNSKHGAIIRNKKSPLNMKEIESYVGLAQFFGRLIPVLQQNVYLWTQFERRLQKGERGTERLRKHKKRYVLIHLLSLRGWGEKQTWPKTPQKRQ